MRRLVSSLQGLYYVLTGLWPLVSMETFLAVSGPKTDLWLVRTVALLILVIGTALLTEATLRRTSLISMVIGISSATVLAWIDFYYALTGVIWAVYMLDGFAEIGIILLWILALVRGPRTVT